MTGPSQITPVSDLENRCEPERAGPAQLFARDLDRAIVEAELHFQNESLRYWADVRAAIYNLDLVRVTR